MLCPACMWSRVWTGLPCHQHRQQPTPTIPPQPVRVPPGCTTILPFPRDDTADRVPRRLTHRLSDAEARWLLLEDIVLFGEPAPPP
jgi:hypothetical protein